MTDVCQGGPTTLAGGLNAERAGATEERNRPPAEINRNYEYCVEGDDLASSAVSCPHCCKEGLNVGGSGQEVVRWDQQQRHGALRVQWCTFIYQWSDYARRWRNKFLRLDAATRQALCACVIGFMGLRLLAHLRLVVSSQRQSPFRILADHRMPALIAFESAIYVGPEFVMYFCLPALRRAGNVGPFAAWLLMKLCYTTWMVASSKVNGPLLVSGFKMMRDRAVMASTFYAHNSYSKYLVCRPRTLPDLYGSRTSALPEICHEPSGLSREDILKACACLYEVLASSEHGELIQVLPPVMNA
ncbi:uncharacterized protein LOC144134330 [Amblyomma americanum]